MTEDHGGFPVGAVLVGWVLAVQQALWQKLPGMRSIFEVAGRQSAEEGDVLTVTVDHDSTCVDDAGGCGAMLDPIGKT